MIYNSHKQQLRNIFNKKNSNSKFIAEKHKRHTCLVKSILVGERMDTLLLKE